MWNKNLIWRFVHFHHLCYYLLPIIPPEFIQKLGPFGQVIRMFAIFSLCDLHVFLCGSNKNTLPQHNDAWQMVEDLYFTLINLEEFSLFKQSCQSFDYSHVVEPLSNLSISKFKDTKNINEIQPLSGK